MKKHFIFFAISLYSMIANAEESGIKLEMKLNLREVSRDGILVEVKLRNPNQMPVELFDSSLSRLARNMLMVAVSNDIESLRIPGPDGVAIDDLGLTKLALKPLDEVSGSMDLLDRFPTLDSVLQSHEVIVFWSCDAILINSKNIEIMGNLKDTDDILRLEKVERMSGVVVIPRQKIK